MSDSFFKVMISMSLYVRVENESSLILKLSLFQSTVTLTKRNGSRALGGQGFRGLELGLQSDDVVELEVRPAGSHLLWHRGSRNPSSFGRRWRSIREDGIVERALSSLVALGAWNSPGRISEYMLSFLGSQMPTPSM